MGCNNSQIATQKVPVARTPFDTTPVESVFDVVYQAQCQGPRSVHVTGRVVHTGSVIEAPFSGQQCLMVNVVVYMSETKKPKKGKTPQPVCSGSNLLGFKILGTIDGRTKEIFIEPGVWEMHFERTNTFTDIRLDKEKESLVCKSENSRKLKELPGKSKDFWDRFIHEIGPLKVELPDVKDKAWKGSLDVHEFALREGDAVAVLGRVKVVNNKTVIEAAGKSIGMITNKRSMAASIKCCPPGITCTSKPEVVPFQQDTE